MVVPAAFRRLCVETDDCAVVPIVGKLQPPSGGCVLKPKEYKKIFGTTKPAAFRRLCVETHHGYQWTFIKSQPPSGGCVLKQPFLAIISAGELQPPSGGCVLKLYTKYIISY